MSNGPIYPWKFEPSIYENEVIKTLIKPKNVVSHRDGGPNEMMTSASSGYLNSRTSWRSDGTLVLIVTVITYCYRTWSGKKPQRKERESRKERKQAWYREKKKERRKKRRRRKRRSNTGLLVRFSVTTNCLPWTRLPCCLVCCSPAFRARVHDV